MKNFKKFTLGVMGAALLATGLWACSNDNEAAAAGSSVESTQTAAREIIFKKMRLPDQIQSFDEEFELITEDVIYIDAKGIRNEGQIRFRVPYNDMKIVSIEFSANLLEAAEVNEEYFISNPGPLLEAYGDPENDKDKDSGLQGDDRSHGERMKWCYDNFEKKQGRGGCVAGEWVTTVGKAFKNLFGKNEK